MYTDLFHALLERRNVRKHPLLSALLYEFCPQAAFFWRSGLDPQPVFDPAWQALQDYAHGGTLYENLVVCKLEDFSPAAEQYVIDIQDFRSANAVRSPETTALFMEAKPTAEERRKFTQAVEKHFGGWGNLYKYIRAWAFLIGDWRLRSGISNEQPYLLRKNSILLHVPELGTPVYWPVWAWWVKAQNTTSVHIGLLTPDGERDPLRPVLVRTSNLEGDSPWPGGLPILHTLNYRTGAVAAPEYLFSDEQAKLLLAKLASIAETGPYPPLNMLRHPEACQYCGFYPFCYNNDRPTELALRGLEDVPTWQADAH
jgi:hypothetical protein